MEPQRATVVFELELVHVAGDVHPASHVLEWWILDQLNGDGLGPPGQLGKVEVQGDDDSDRTTAVYHIVAAGHRTLDPLDASGDLRGRTERDAHYLALLHVDAQVVHPGDHVAVTGGPHKGRTGWVTSMVTGQPVRVRLTAKQGNSRGHTVEVDLAHLARAAQPQPAGPRPVMVGDRVWFEEGPHAGNHAMVLAVPDTGPVQVWLEGGPMEPVEADPEHMGPAEMGDNQEWSK